MRATTQTKAKYFMFSDLYDSRSIRATTPETKSPGAKRFRFLERFVLRREIIEYEMIDVEKCTTIYIVSIVNISQSHIRSSPYWAIV